MYDATQKVDFLQTSEPKTSYTVNQEISLTVKEKEIFDFMIEVLKENDKKTTLRVAGGWVRDKLLGQHSDDIDIALDDMYGEEFAELLRKKIYDEEVAAGKIDPKK